MTPFTSAFSSALVHFVWQGAVVAMLLSITLLAMRRATARMRYAVSCTALAALALLPMITTTWLYTPAPAFAAKVARSTPDAQATAEETRNLARTPQLLAAIQGWGQKWALPVWSIGVLLFAIRLLWGCRQVAALRRNGEPADANSAIMHSLSRLAARLKIDRPVQVLISALPGGPSVVGWLRPVILLPAATLAGLTPDQLEAVLAHELAHISRHDYLVNLLQSVVETLLFYHPAVWWISGRIREERELCCDDLAVTCCGDALCYARALTELEKLRSTTPLGEMNMTLAAARGSLLHRIERILTGVPEEYRPSKLTGLVVLAIGLGAAALNVSPARAQEPVHAAGGWQIQSRVADNVPKVDLRGAEVLHIAPVQYPKAAAEAGITGDVVVEATLDAHGNVSDARVVSGPMELRKAALQSVLQWHFANVTAGATRQVAVTFETPARVAVTGQLQLEPRIEPDPKVKEELRARTEAQLGLSMQLELVRNQVSERQRQIEELSKQYQSNHPEMLRAQRELMQLEQQLRFLAEQRAALDGAKQSTENREFLVRTNTGDVAMGTMAVTVPGSVTGRAVARIDFLGLSDSVREQIMQKLPVRIGDAFTHEAQEATTNAVTSFDEHFTLRYYPLENGQMAIAIGAPGTRMEPRREPQ